MGKESKIEKKSGISIVVTVRDGVKKIDEMELDNDRLFIQCLAYEALKAPASSRVADLIKKRDKFIETKRFLEKYQQ